VSRSTGARLLSTVHGWTGHSTRERYIYYPAHKRLLARFPLTLAVSSDIRQQLVRTGSRPDRVQLLLNGIDHERFRRDPTQVRQARARVGVSVGDVLVGAVGRLEPQKRFDVLIDACARVRSSVPFLQLVIAGEGSERARLEKHVADHGHASWCRLIGHVVDVVALHHALDVFVQSSAYEGTPNVVLEAMAMETPIVATDVGGTREICRPNLDGLSVPAENAVALQRGIEEVLADPSGRCARVQSARRRVEAELSFIARVHRLEQIYEGLVR
jgi:glycosyltransferase involved in cell wall biosynthesis